MKPVLLACALALALYAPAQQWEPVGQGVGVENSRIYDLQTWNGDLYMVGAFTSIADVGPVWAIARWDGIQYHALPPRPGIHDTFPPNYSTLGIGDTALYVGGSRAPASTYEFHGLDAWNGDSWTTVVESLSTSVADVYAIVTINDTLFIGGKLNGIEGVPVSRIGRLADGQWDDMGGGVYGVSQQVHCLAEYHGTLHVGGYFHTAGGIQGIYNLASYDGQNWDSLGTGGPNYLVKALEVDTAGDLLYASGLFDAVGGLYSPNVAAWNGSQWSALPGSEKYAGIECMKMYRGQLFVGTHGWEEPTDSIIGRWDGYQWHPIVGPNWSVLAMEVYEDRLYVAGDFVRINDMDVLHLASYYLPPDCNYYPTPRIAIDTTVVYAAAPVTFGHNSIVTPGDSITSYSWDFGDGFTGSGESVQHTFMAAGTYDATLTITNAAGCSFDAVVQLKVDHPLQIGVQPATSRYSLYPNPAGRVVTISGRDTPGLQLFMYTSQGKLLHQEQLPQLPAKVQLPETGPDVIHYELRTAERVLQTGTLLVQN